MIDSKTHRRLAPHEFLRKGDEFNWGGTLGWRPASSIGCEALSINYRRKIRPSSRAGYRWADEGEAAKEFWSPSDGLAPRNTECQKLGREMCDAGMYLGVAGAVMPWPEDPRILVNFPAPENEPKQENSDDEMIGRTPEGWKGDTKSREEREREAWEKHGRCETKVEMWDYNAVETKVYAELDDNELAPILSVDELIELRDALNHRIRELRADKIQEDPNKIDY